LRLGEGGKLESQNGLRSTEPSLFVKKLLAGSNQNIGEQSQAIV